MKAPKLNWRPISERPDEPGYYLIWSHKRGIRMTKAHPSWWNRDLKYADSLGRVSKWAYLGPLGMGMDLRTLRAEGKTTTREET